MRAKIPRSVRGFHRSHDGAEKKHNGGARRARDVRGRMASAVLAACERRRDGLDATRRSLCFAYSVGINTGHVASSAPESSLEIHRCNTQKPDAPLCNRLNDRAASTFRLVQRSQIALYGGCAACFRSNLNLSPIYDVLVAAAPFLRAREDQSCIAILCSLCLRCRECLLLACVCGASSRCALATVSRTTVPLGPTVSSGGTEPPALGHRTQH